VRKFKTFSASVERVACSEWVQTRHKEKECDVVIGAGYVAAVKCGNKTTRCTCRHEKDQFSRDLILWQVLENCDYHSSVPEE
jgi:hypothetical protein